MNCIIHFINYLNRYNSAVKLFEKTKYSFHGHSFSVRLVKDGPYRPETHHLVETSKTSGINYPQRDKKEKNDPDILTYKPVYYSNSTTPPIGNLTIKFDGDIKIQDFEFIGNPVVEHWSTKEVGCDERLQECYLKCKALPGIWESPTRTCLIKHYITKICLRVKPDNRSSDSYLLDVDSPMYKSPYRNSILQDSGSCNFGTNEKIQYQILLKPPSTVPMEIHLYSDPYIYVDDLTEGCSSSYYEYNNCFGDNSYKNWNAGLILFIIGNVLMYVLPFMLYFATTYEIKPKVRKAKKTYKRVPTKPALSSAFEDDPKAPAVGLVYTIDQDALNTMGVQLNQSSMMGRSINLSSGSFHM